MFNSGHLFHLYSLINTGQSAVAVNTLFSFFFHCRTTVYCIGVVYITCLCESERPQCLKSGSIPNKCGWPDSPQPRFTPTLHHRTAVCCVDVCIYYISVYITCMYVLHACLCHMHIYIYITCLSMLHVWIYYICLYYVCVYYMTVCITCLYI